MPRITYEYAMRAPEVSDVMHLPPAESRCDRGEGFCVPCALSRYATQDGNTEYRSGSLCVGQSLVERNPCEVDRHL